MSDFGYSFTEEIEYFTTGFTTSDGAFDAAVADKEAALEHKPFYISCFYKPTLKWTTGAEEIINEICDNLADDTGADFIDEIADENEFAALETALNDCINGWIKEYNIASSYSLISWTKRYIWDAESSSYIKDDDYCP